MDNLEIYNKYRVVPPEAQKNIGGGRLKGMTDINPMWRIKALTEQFGLCGFGWYYNTTKKWTETHENKEVCAFVDIELFVSIDDRWSMPISGTGGSMLAVNESGGIHISDECYKMATTDAISVACKQLGFGADIYWNKDSTKYTSGADNTDKPIENNTSNNFAKHDEQVGIFHQEIQRTGKSLKWFLDSSKVKDAKYIKGVDLEKYIAGLKALPDKV